MRIINQNILICSIYLSLFYNVLQFYYTLFLKFIDQSAIVYALTSFFALSKV